MEPALTVHHTSAAGGKKMAEKHVDQTTAHQLRSYSAMEHVRIAHLIRKEH